jgi:hypothetical protein
MVIWIPLTPMENNDQLSCWTSCHERLQQLSIVFIGTHTYIRPDTNAVRTSWYQQETEQWAGKKKIFSNFVIGLGLEQNSARSIE